MLLIAPILPEQLYRVLYILCKAFLLEPIAIGESVYTTEELDP